MTDVRKETDSMGVVEVPADKLWGAQTERSLEHFNIGNDLIPREMITAYAILKKAAAEANHASKRLSDEKYKLITQVCDEIIAGQNHDMLPLHVWMTGSGTQFHMNVNEVISNRCCQIAATPLGSKTPVHPNDDVNMAQSSNDTFPTAMNIAAAVNVKQRLIPAVTALRDALKAKAQAWKDIVKIGRTHMQDATLRTLAVSLCKIANDIRLVSCGPRAGFAELSIPENEPGSSIMPGKVNPTQCEALAMVAVQVMADDVAVGFGGASGYLEMNVYKPLIIFNITHAITLMTDSCTHFRKFLVEGTKPNLKKIHQYVEESLMLVTALSPVIGYDKASKIAHYAMDNDLTLKAAALKLGFVTETEFDRIVDPSKMVEPYVAKAACWFVILSVDPARARLGCAPMGLQERSDLVLALARVLHENGQSTDETVAAAERLSNQLGLRATFIPGWGELELQATAGTPSFASDSAADPTGTDMDRVASAMRAIDQVATGRLAPPAAHETIPC